MLAETGSNTKPLCSATWANTSDVIRMTYIKRAH